ncbi:MAG: hypothetical protein ABW277_19705 [Longimicrobiaceae bacterium]
MKAARFSLALLLAASAAVSAPRTSPDDDEVVTVSPFLGSGGKAAPVG